MEQETLISVVVPIYKVEKYIEKCIESLINQTYSNLEIILVDDGSPDKCGEICDNYALQDSRIRVIHKKNGGLSDARNVGIKAATGRYIACVDSDDYIEKNMYEVMINCLMENKADIAVCGVILEKEDCPQSVTQKEEIVKCFNSREAIMDLFERNRYFRHAAWNKLYKRELFDSILFPVGRLYEDAAIMYKIFEKAERIVYTSHPLYHYIQRFGSISFNNYNSKGVLHQFENRIGACDYYQKDDELRYYAYKWHIRFVRLLWNEAYENGDKELANRIHITTKKITNKSIMRKLNIKEKIIICSFVLYPKSVLLMFGIKRLLKGKKDE